MSKFITLKTEPNRVVFGGTFEIVDEALYQAFKNQAAAKHDEYFEKALRLGVYGLEQETIAAFLGRAESELDASLEKLKLLYKMQNLREKGAAKGAIAEVELADVLQKYIDDARWKDNITDTGSKIGALPRRKVGDLTVEIAGGAAVLTIESKFDKTTTVGDTTKLDARGKASVDGEKTANGQLLTALVNRGAQIAIIVFDADNCHNSVSELGDVTFVPELPGFIVKVRRAQGDFTNACLAYSIAREMALLGADKVSGDHVNLAIKRMVRDLNVLASISATLDDIEGSAKATIDSVESIRDAIALTEKSLQDTQDKLKGVLAGNQTALDQWREFFLEA
jgi:hypothetical protein